VYKSRGKIERIEKTRYFFCSKSTKNVVTSLIDSGLNAFKGCINIVLGRNLHILYISINYRWYYFNETIPESIEIIEPLDLYTAFKKGIF